MSELKDHLTDDDKKFIVDNYNKMSVLQMSFRLNIRAENRKCPIISDFIKNANLSLNTSTEEKSVVLAPAPETVEDAVENIIKEETKEAVDDEKPYETITIEEFANVLRGLNIKVRETLSETEKIDILFVIHQLESTRYLLNYRSFKRKEHKHLFKEEFIRSMYGKGEMPQEEVNDFIDLCNEVVVQYDIKCRMRELEKLKEKKDINPGQVASIESLLLELQNQYTNSSKRASEIKRSLGANREQRLKDNRPKDLTISMLIESFHNTEKREALVKLQEKRDKELKNAIKLIDDLDEMKATILGINPEELLSGGL
jgi:hypothetical protein